MTLGILLGHFVPSMAPALQRGELEHVSLPVGELAFPPL